MLDEQSADLGAERRAADRLGKMRERVGADARAFDERAMTVSTARGAPPNTRACMTAGLTACGRTSVRRSSAENPAASAR